MGFFGKEHRTFDMQLQFYKIWLLSQIYILTTPNRIGKSWKKEKEDLRFTFPLFVFVYCTLNSHVFTDLHSYYSYAYLLVAYVFTVF